MLSFWIVAVVISLTVAAILIRAVVRGNSLEAESRAASDVAVYRAQLAEVDRDVARGVIDKADAERVHAEVARRLIAADTAQSAENPKSNKAPTAVAIIIIVFAVIVSGLSYWKLGVPGFGDMALKDRIAFAEEVRKSRPNQARAEASLPTFVEPIEMDPRYKELLTQLRGTVAQRPDDIQGHILLVQQERRIGNYLAAKDAQIRLINLKGDPVSGQDLADLGELQVMAAGGYVSPEAETSLRGALNLDPQNGAARYYLGLMLVQTGRPDQAFRIWDSLLRAGPEDAAWIPPILEQIEGLAQLAGVRYSIPEIGGAGMPGPTAEDVENAQSMSPAERMEMIGGMVAGLSERLATRGGPPSDWARLISSLGVLGEQQRAMAIHANAIEVFSDNKDALDLINEAGRKAGVID
ncbi:cytochrome c-type biogenesis protein CcmH [Sulfitobacter undariae]|uniref:Cytochrome c-type biogenesis protein CcmH n=1 Tax=Sulfitobacter undariae TaxID=1563671 RepID=A0A7W6E5V8_9RHOB|nr:c-type cytochrome biogenesis protein CcmI [Sulfitobacter undariae]MBB3995332.1 cytochrome c-type biogenesis protein CcmH [Sulfitobacter undariae]